MKHRETARNPLQPEDLDDIRSGLDWQALFQGLGLEKDPRKSKPEDWWAKSPFHDERTASFHMRPGGVWYDFSIGEGGGALELVQKLYDCNCFEAGQIILEEGWSPLSRSKPDTQVKRTARKIRQKISAPLPEPENAPIRQDLMPMTSYHPALAERGLSETTCENLGIGYLAQGRSPLRGRIVFQVGGVLNRNAGYERTILSHIGRAVKAEQEPKYLFYEGFHKSLELLGQDRLWLDDATIEHIRQQGQIILTEGPFDWAKCIQAGLLNACACLGSSLSQPQAEKLKALAEHHGLASVLLAFDRDQAGQVGAAKAAELLQSLGLEVSTFDWNQAIGRGPQGLIYMPAGLNDLGDLSAEQLAWLRKKRLL